MASATAAQPIPVPPTAFDPEALYEIVNGERREVPHMGVLAGVVASLLLGCLNAFVIPRKLGLAMAEVLFRFAPDRSARRPDLAFVAYDRWPLTAPPSEDPPELNVVPNLAVEVVSPSNTADGIIDKIEEYFAAGVQLVWVIYPRQRLVYVYQSSSDNHILRESDDLDGGQVLPGFRLALADLFAPLVKPA